MPPLERSLGQGLSGVRSVIADSLSAWIDHRAASKGAALAFYTLFSMTPILILAIAGAARFLGAEAAQGEIIALVEGMLGREGAEAIRSLLASARDRDTSLVAALIASVVLLVAAAAVFVELKGSLDELWGFEPPKGRAVIAFLRTQLHSFGLVLVLALLLLASLALGAVIEVVTPGSDRAWLPSILSFGVVACLFAVIFKVLPEVALSWRDAWIGASFTAILFSLGKLAIGLYLGRSSVPGGFGAAGALIAVLLWVYYSAQIFFLGAEFTRQYALRFGSLRAGDPRATGDAGQPHSRGADSEVRARCGRAGG
jgi:membrane protein